MHKNPGSHTSLWMIRLCPAVVVLWLCMSISPVSFAQDISVSAKLSTSTITRDESVTLTITARGIDAELDASSLDEDFDVVGRSSSRELSTRVDSSNQIVTTSVVTWALELLPKGMGIFTVPAVKVGDYETQLQTLTVNEVPSGAKRDIFVEASVDTTEPWVQSQVVMTLRVYQAIDIVDGGLDVPAADDLVVERLDEDTRSREVLDGREYSVTERRFAMFPQRSGSITIEPVTLSVTVPAEPDRVRGFFSPTRKLIRRSDPVILDVQARPPAGVAWWLPAKNLDLRSQWQGDPNAAQVDQPLTRTVIVRAEGVLESQLPTISIPAVDGLSLYAEDPSVGRVVGPSGLISEQQINWALIPQRSGTLTLPAITVEWFNTLTGQTETAELPAETITVLAAGSVSSDAAATNSNNSDSTELQATESNTDALTASSESLQGAGPDNDLLSESNANPGSQSATNALTDSIDIGDDNIAMQQVDTLQSSAERWRILAFVAVALWMLTAAAWYLFRRASASDQTAVSPDRGRPLAAQVSAAYLHLAPMSQVDGACKAGDFHAIKEALLVWAKRQWPDSAPTTLDGLQAQLADSKARTTLAKLQTALYSRAEQSEQNPELEGALANLPNDLKLALQQVHADSSDSSLDTSTVNKGSVSITGSSRLPRL